MLINGFGGTPLQELYLFNNSVTGELAKRNIKISRTFVGNFMTSIDMQGASVSIMKLDEQLKKLLSEESDTPAFKVSGPVEAVEYVSLEANSDIEHEVSFDIETCDSFACINNEKVTLNNMVYIMDNMSEVIIKNEVPFCELDSYAGDGDFGMSVAKGFKQLKREWKEILSEEHMTIGEFLKKCSLVIMENCGGASGPIWGSAFRAAGKQVETKNELTVSEFAEMMNAAVVGIQSTGERSFGRGAVVGDKTLIDALVPCADAWKECAKADISFKEAFERGAKAAVEGARKTEKL